MQPPSLPALIPFGEWRTRCRKAGFVHLGTAGVDGGTNHARLSTDLATIHIYHRGTGAGYGGRRPVMIRGYRIENPGSTKGAQVGGPGTLAPGEPPQKGFDDLDPGVLRFAFQVLNDLFLDLPEVHSYHPDAVKQRLARFVEKGSRYSLVFVSNQSAASSLLETPLVADTQNRIAVYGRLAAGLALAEVSLSVAKTTKWGTKERDVLFSGSPDQLVANAAALSTTLSETRFRIEAEGLTIEDRVTSATVVESALAISRHKNQGDVWVGKIETAAALDIEPNTSVPAIKKMLIAFTKSSGGKLFDVHFTRGENLNSVKRGKLPRLATVIAPRLVAGPTRVSVSGAKTATAPARLWV